MKSIFITGGTGFIGRHVVEKLQNATDARLIVLTRSKHDDTERIRYITGDLSDLQLLRQHIIDCDTVIHMAGCKKDPANYVAANVIGTENVLYACKTHGACNLIYLSSVGVIGENPDLVLTENSRCYPANDYEKSKYTAELKVKEYADTATGKTFILRPTNVFGENDPELHLLNLMRKIKSGKFMYVGTDCSSFHLNYVYVKEISELVHMMLSCDRDGTFIINTPVKLEEFIDSIMRKLGVSHQIPHLPYMPVKIGASFFDLIPKSILKTAPINSLKLRELTNRKIYSSNALVTGYNWQPAYSVEQALLNLIRHYKDNKMI